jgi:hypothetical protein
VTAVSRQLGNAIVPAVAAAATVERAVAVPRIGVRASRVPGFGRMVDVKSDAAGDARLCYHISKDASGGLLVYTELVGADASIHVPFYELAAVYLCTMMHCAEWRGEVVRFGVDSAPVVSMLNTGSSRDPDLMRLLRDMADMTFVHDFDWIAVHVTRSRNALADQGTRHVLPQDFNGYLGAEGYATLASEATPVTCHGGSSQLQCGAILGLPLGPRLLCTESRRPSGTPAL